jgi:hypothetical protein
MSKKIEAIYKFLQAARNLVKNKNATKDQIIAFAKQQFGEIDDFFKLQIDNLFRKPKVVSPVEEAYKRQVSLCLKDKLMWYLLKKLLMKKKVTTL